MAFDLSALSAWTDERADEFFSKSVLAAKTPSLMRVLTGLKGATAIPNLEGDSDIFRSGSSCGFTAVGDVAIDQRTINPQSVKVNIELCLRDLEAFFTRQLLPAGQMYEGLGPVEAAILEEVRKRIQRTVEIAVWQSEIGGAGATSLTIFDGLIEIIQDEIAAATIPAGQQLSGAVTTGNIIATVEAMRDALPVDQFDEVTEESKYIMLMSPQAKQTYERDYRSTFTALPYNMEFNKLFVDGTKIEIIGVPGLFAAAHSDKILLVKRESLWLGVDIEGEQSDLMVYMDQDRENVRIKSRFMMGTQVNFPEELVVNNF